MRTKITGHTSQAGFTLIELMVAVTVGLVIMGGLAMVFVGSKATYQTQNKMTRLQENARFAMGFIQRNFRMAGYTGCANNSLSDPAGSIANEDLAVEGINNAYSGNTWIPSGATPASTYPLEAGSDAITLRFLDPESIAVVTGIPSDTSLNVDSPGNFSSGDVVGITNCAQSVLFTLTCSETGGVCTNPLTSNVGILSFGDALIGNDAVPRVMKYNEFRYFVLDQASNDGKPSLYMASNRNDIPTGELVEGVESMQILYGIDTTSPGSGSPDGVPDRYVSADYVGAGAGNWQTVVSIRVGLLMRTVGEYGTEEDTRTYDVLNETIDPNDLRVRRRVFVTTVKKRNNPIF